MKRKGMPMERRFYGGLRMCRNMDISRTMSMATRKEKAKK